MRFLLSILLFSCSLYSHEILILGDAIIDHTVFVDDDFIEGELGGSFMVDFETFQHLIRDDPIKSSGGSATNTTKALGALGHDAAFIGRIGNDPDSEMYIQSLLDYRVTPLLTPYDVSTPRVVCMVSPAGKRTMRSHFPELVQSAPAFPLNPKDFEGIKLFHIEGYQIFNSSFLKEAIALAKAEEALISMDMACFELVRNFHSVFMDLIQHDIDILFANSLEAKTLLGLDPSDACIQLSKFVKVAIVTMGEKGGYVGCNDEAFYYPAVPTQQVDDTGAGDIFIAGFLHGYLNGYLFTECASTGAKLAARIVEIVGTELPKERLLAQQSHVRDDH